MRTERTTWHPDRNRLRSCGSPDSCPQRSIPALRRAGFRGWKETCRSRSARSRSAHGRSGRLGSCGSPDSCPQRSIPALRRAGFRDGAASMGGGGQPIGGIGYAQEGLSLTTDGCHMFFFLAISIQQNGEKTMTCQTSRFSLFSGGGFRRSRASPGADGERSEIAPRRETKAIAASASSEIGIQPRSRRKKPTERTARRLLIARAASRSASIEGHRRAAEARFPEIKPRSRTA